MQGAIFCEVCELACEKECDDISEYTAIIPCEHGGGAKVDFNSGLAQRAIFEKLTVCETRYVGLKKKVVFCNWKAK